MAQVQTLPNSVSLHIIYILARPQLICLQVNDTEALRAARIAPSAVGRVMDDAFAEMTFIHGYIHADPHPGNIMVRSKGKLIKRYL